MIASTQIANAETFAFIAVLDFKLLSKRFVCFCLLFMKITDFKGKLLQIVISWNVKFSGYY